MDFISPDIANVNLAEFMSEALLEAEVAGQSRELLIGAVLVINGQIASRGQARHRALQSQLRHAELNAMLDGGEKLWREYSWAILFSTVEPCSLCLGAAVMADIPHIIFALHDKVNHSSQIVETNPYIRSHIKTYHGGVLAVKSAAILEMYDPQAFKYITIGRA